MEWGCINLLADLLHDLHWLPVCHNVTFKVATLWYRSYRVGQPSYFSPYIPTRRLRYSDMDLLAEPPHGLLLANDGSAILLRVFGTIYLLMSHLLIVWTPSRRALILTFSPLLNIEYQSPCPWFSVSVETGTLNVYFWFDLISLPPPGLSVTIHCAYISNVCISMRIVLLSHVVCLCCDVVVLEWYTSGRRRYVRRIAWSPTVLHWLAALSNQSHARRFLRYGILIVLKYKESMMKEI